jgi:hypothetical protein
MLEADAMTRIWPSFAVLLALGAPGATWADAFVSADPACRQIAAVQFLDCKLDLVFTCPPIEGEIQDVIRYEGFGEAGPTYAEITSMDGITIRFASSSGNYRVQTDRASRKGTSNAELIASGQGKWIAERTVVRNGTEVRGRSTRVVTSVGPTEVLGGIKFMSYVSETVRDFPQPEGTSRYTFRLYVSPALPGVSLIGEDLSGDGFDPKATPHRPMALALPGAPDFVTKTPAYCTATLS